MPRIDCRLECVVLGVLVALVPVTSHGQQVQWRHDYAAARRQAKETNRPMVLDFGTKSCFFCKKLDTSTFRDARVVKELNERFIPIKIDAEEQAQLATALGIESFPTLLFAAPDGKILGIHEGFVETGRFQKQLQRALKESVAKAPSPAVVRGASEEEPAPVREAPPIAGARQLVEQAEQAFRDRDYVACLERCGLVARLYPTSPEAAQAAKLESRIKGEPELERRTCVEMEDRLGDLYLGLAEECVRGKHPEQAKLYWERVVRICGGSHAAEIARARLAEATAPTNKLQQ